MNELFSFLMETLAATSLLYDQPEIMENIESWVGTMSSAGNRPFRHTATAVSLAIVSALCTLGKESTNQAAKFLRMSENERRKSRHNKTLVKEYDDTIKATNANLEVLKGYLTSWFETVFVHRYRDVDPRIRVDCVQALSDWINTFPDVFFDGSYLRYLGWVLSDTNAPTRLEVVKQLQKLYADKSKIGGLKTFTDRFRPRMVEMATRDSEPNVRAAAVDLLDTLRELGLLEPDDIDSVGALIFDSEPRVRKAVVRFFAANVEDLYEAKVEELGGSEALEQLAERENDDNYDVPRIEWLRFKCLVEMLQTYDSDEQLPSQMEHWSGAANYSLVASGIESRFSIAAQSLYSEIAEIKEWQVLAGYLLFDHSKKRQNGAGGQAEESLKTACQLDEKEEIILLEVLDAAVKLGFADTMAAAADKTKNRSKRERQLVMQEQEHDAHQLINLIPRLLKKFGAQPEAASAVLRLEHILSSEAFEELRQDSKTFSALLDDINKQFLTHGNASVLAEASAALLHAKRFDDLGEVTDGKLQALWHDTTSALQALTKDKDVGTRGSLRHNVLSGLVNTVLRLSNLASISDCTEVYESAPQAPAGRSKSKKQSRASEASGPAVVDSLVTILQRGPPAADITPETDELEDQLVTNAAKATLFYFLWKVKNWSDIITSGAAIRYEEVEAMAEREDSFIAQLTHILKKRKGADELRLTAAGTLLDLHCALATLKQARRDRQPSQADDSWALLCLEVDPPTQGYLRDLLAATERAFAKRSKKALEDAVDDEDDPLSDDEPDDDDPADDADAQDAEKLQNTLLAEQRLCELASKLVLSILAGVVDGKELPRKEGERPGAPGPMRQRLQRNKARLGQNYKQVIEFLDVDKKAGKARKAAQAKVKAGNAQAKSREVVEPEDDEDEAMADDAEDEEAMRARGLLVEDDIEDDEGVDPGAAGDEVESVLGD